MAARPGWRDVRGQKLLDKCATLLRDCNLIVELSESEATLSEVVQALLATTEPGHDQFNETQADAWARCAGDLTLDKQLAVEALRMGLLPALPRFLQRYKSNHDVSMSADVGWSDALISLHNFALLEDEGFPMALGKLSSADLTSIAQNLARALKPGLYPSDARDATTRLAQYESMVEPLIESGVLLSLVAFIPTVKPFNRLPHALWGPEALREISNTLQPPMQLAAQALDTLIYIYGKAGREDDLPVKELSSSQLTGWICDVLLGVLGGPATEPGLKEDIEASRVAALDCLTSLLINVPICRAAIPNNRSMLFRVASAITPISSITLLSAAAQVLAQALSEEDLVPPSELASLHTYDLARNLSMVLEHSRDFRELLNVMAALQNTLDPAHFKDNLAAMKKVAERLVACGFEGILKEFVNDPKSRYDTPKIPGGAVYPSSEDFQALVEAAEGALENARELLKAVGPVTVTLLPRPAPPPPRPKSQPAPPPATKPVTEKQGRSTSSSGSARKGAQNIPADVIAAVTGGSGAKRKQPAGGTDGEGGKKKKKAEANNQQGGGQGRTENLLVASSSSAPTMGVAPSCCLPVVNRISLEKELRKAALLVAPLLTAAPLRAVLDWFSEWATSYEKLEQELGTDVHVDGGGHRMLLLDAVEQGDSQACLDLLSDILQVKLPPLKKAARAVVASPSSPPPPPRARTPAKALESAPVPAVVSHTAIAPFEQVVQPDPVKVEVVVAMPPPAKVPQEQTPPIPPPPQV